MAAASASFAIEGFGAREALRRLLCQNGILHAGEGQPIRSRNGEPAPWAFYSWNVSLTPAGLQLIAVNMLERLQTFRSTQLASYGYTGLPILSACVAFGDGKYTGISIRDRRKQTVACRKIDGPLDPARPVVVIDDSISSGTSLKKAIDALEAEGFEVEGSLALVRFPGRGGCEFAAENGYRAEWLFDIWEDLEMRPDMMPRAAVPAARGAYRIADGLAPAAVARQTMEYYLSCGYAPHPPRHLDCDYDGRGGVFVSLRERGTDYRLAREGFWHFDPAEFRPGADVVEASIKTLRRAAGHLTRARLRDWKIGVTFFTPLERIQPRQLDFDRCGIVVRGRLTPFRCGGALPNTQVFISEIEQYHQARVNNACLINYEDHDLFRHDIAKSVEEGENWLPYGCVDGPETNWWKDIALGEMITAYAAEVVESTWLNQELAVSPEFLSRLPAKVEAIAVTLYNADDHERYGLVGFGLSWSPDPREALIEAARTAARDIHATCQPFSVVVSLLHHPETLVHLPLSGIIRKVRRGLDALAVSAGNERHALLPAVIPYNNLSNGQFVEMLMRQAGVTEDGAITCSWATYQTAVWLRSRQGVYPIRFGFPYRESTGYGIRECESDLRLLGSFIFRGLRRNGFPIYRRYPLSGEIEETGSSARILHGLLTLGAAGTVLGEAEWTAAAVRSLRIALRSRATDGPLADCVLLAGISMLDPELAQTRETARLAGSLGGLLQGEGSIRRGRKILAMRHDHDYLPGGVLWAIGSYCRATGCDLPDGLDRQLAFYQRRFRATPTWGAAGWQPQGWQAILEAAADPVAGAREFIFEAAEWAIERQLEKNGAFLEDLSPDEPSFNTGFLAEGIAAAWTQALAAGDCDRAEKYQKSWSRGMDFMRKLMIREEDTFCMRDPGKALGGVRCMQSRSDVRIDQVSHCLHALIEGWKNLSADGAGG